MSGELEDLIRKWDAKSRKLAIKADEGGPYDGMTLLEWEAEAKGIRSCLRDLRRVAHSADLLPVRKK